MTTSITKATFSALRWNYVGFLVRSGSNFLIGIVLARLLGPKPFGQIAAATLIVGVANLVADAGFSSAIIQAVSLTELQIRFVFTAQILSAVAMSLFCMLSAPLVAAEFHDPAVRWVVIGIAPIFILQALGQTASSLLRRDLSFKPIQSAQLLSYFIGYIAFGIPLAIKGAGVWSLVVAQLVQTTVLAGLLYARVQHAITPTFSSTGRVLLRFGAKVTASNVVNYMITNADNFFVGHTFGSLTLGFYNRAFSLANAPADGIIGAIQQVLFSSCSRAEGRLPSIRRAYLTSLSAVGMLVLPAFWCLAVVPNAVIVGLYGPQWTPAARLFRPLILALSIHTLMAMAGPILASLNLVEREIRAQSLTLCIALLTFWFAGRHSIEALAWGVCGVYAFRFFVMTGPVIRALNIGWKGVLRALTGPSVIAFLAGSAVRFSLIALNRFSVPSSAGLIVVLTIGALVTLGMFFLAARFLAARWLISFELLEVVYRLMERLPASFSKAFPFGGAAQLSKMNSSLLHSSPEATSVNEAGA